MFSGPSGTTEAFVVGWLPVGLVALVIDMPASLVMAVLGGLAWFVGQYHWQRGKARIRLIDEEAAVRAKNRKRYIEANAGDQSALIARLHEEIDARKEEWLLLRTNLDECRAELAMVRLELAESIRAERTMRGMLAKSESHEDEMMAKSESHEQNPG